jgi:hypothetical protein
MEKIQWKNQTVNFVAIVLVYTSRQAGGED